MLADVPAVSERVVDLALPIPPWPLAYQDWPFYYPLLALLVLAVAVSALVRRSKLGLGLFAIKDDEGKAAGLGLATSAYKPCSPSWLYSVSNCVGSTINKCVRYWRNCWALIQPTTPSEG